MTHTDFRNTIAALGLTQRATAKLLGVSERRSRAWALGETPVPTLVGVLLRLLHDGKIQPADIEAAAGAVV